MRIAALADVHGNLLALDAVLADVATRSVDVTVDLGDLLSGGLQPRETADRLMAADLLTVRGNHERQLLSTPPDRMTPGGSDRLAHDTITDRHRAWLASGGHLDGVGPRRRGPGPGRRAPWRRRPRDRPA